MATSNSDIGGFLPLHYGDRCHAKPGYSAEHAASKLPDLAWVRRFHGKFGDGLCPSRMREVGDDFGQGNEDEFALEHARMRHLQFRRVNGLVAVKKNIYVNQPRPFWHKLFAAHA